MTEAIRTCVPKRPRGRILAARLAIQENPANHPPALALALSSPQHAAILTGKMWATGKVLPVAFRGGRQSDRNAFLAAGAEWSHYANIRIAFTRDDRASILRVAFWDASDDPGSWSYVGTDALTIPKTEATINLGWPNDPGRDLHEVGHALGLIHEHQNPLARIPWNRQAVYAHFMGPPNNWLRFEVDAQVLDNVNEPLTNGGYDRQSIMSYPIPASLLTDPRAAVGWNKVLSVGDKRLIGRVYPFQIAQADVIPFRPPGRVPVTFHEQVQSVLAKFGDVVDGDPIDPGALGIVLIEALQSGGQAAVWPALVDQVDRYVTNPQVLADARSILKAIDDPTLEHVVAAALQLNGSPAVKTVVTDVVDTFRGLIGLSSE